MINARHKARSIQMSFASIVRSVSRPWVADGANGETRTHNHRVTNAVLCQLSYEGMEGGAKRFRYFLACPAA